MEETIEVFGLLLVLCKPPLDPLGIWRSECLHEAWLHWSLFQEPARLSTWVGLTMAPDNSHTRRAYHQWIWPNNGSCLIFTVAHHILTSSSRTGTLKSKNKRAGFVEHRPLADVAGVGQNIQTFPENWLHLGGSMARGARCLSTPRLAADDTRPLTLFSSWAFCRTGSCACLCPYTFSDTEMYCTCSRGLFSKRYISFRQ